MGWLRGLGRWSGVGLAGVLLACPLALIPAAVLDRGPGGAVRFSLFPIALVALDPFVRDCARNSLAVATIVSIGSMLLGLAIARIIVRWRFWGRLPLAALAIGPVVVPPLFSAMGMSVFLGPVLGGPGGWVAHLVPWCAWIWVGLAGGVPLVAMATASTLARVEPAWGDAARMAGVGRVRVWRKFVWSAVRPSVARSTGTVFALTLIEPGAPPALGLRRTLAFHVVEAAMRPNPAPRAAVLALAALGLAVVGRVLVSWWGGPSELHLSTNPVARVGPASWRRALGFVTLLGAVAILAWLPILALIATGLARAPDATFGISFAAFARRLNDPDAHRLIANSLAIGLGAVAIDLILVRALTGRYGQRGRWLRVLAIWPEMVPPLVLGVGALVVPGLLQMGADGLRAVGSREVLARALQAVADVLDPFRTPGVLLALGVAAARLPLVARAVEAGRGGSRRAMIDAAIVMGATPARARRIASGGRFGASAGALLLSVSLAATSLAPALVLATTSESRTVAPGILILADVPGEGRHRASALATCALAANLASFALAARSRPRPLARWFRGGP